MGGWCRILILNLLFQEKSLRRVDAKPWPMLCEQVLSLLLWTGLLCPESTPNCCTEHHCPANQHQLVHMLCWHGKRSCQEMA